MLEKHISVQEILTQVKVKDWQESVRIAGELLYKAGKITRGYIDGMIRTIKELGPYAVIAPGVALPHARPEDGALEVGFSIVVLKDPINFGSPNDPVKVVMAFSAPDKSSHITILQELVLLLSNEDFRREIMSAKTPEEVLEIIRTYEKSITKEAQS